MSDQDKISTGNYLITIKRVFIKRLWLIILIAFVVSISAFVTSKIIEPVYESSTSIRVQAPIQMTANKARQEPGFGSLEPEAMWLKSRYLVELVMKNLGIGTTAKNKNEYIEIMEKLQNNINVKPFTGANTLLLTVQWNDSEMVANITNNLADTFIEKYEVFNNSMAKEKRTFIEEQLNMIRIKLDEAQKNLVEFQKKEGVFSLDESIKDVSQRISMWEIKKYQVQIDVNLAQSKFDQIKDQMAQTKETREIVDNKDLYSRVLNDNPKLLSMQKNISMLEAEVVSMSYRYTDEFPMLLSKKKELEDIKKQFQNELNKIILEITPENNTGKTNSNFVASLIQIEMEINAKKNEEKILNDLIKNEREKVKILPEKQILYFDILRDKNVNEEHYTLLLKKLAEARIEENVDMWDVRVFDRAYAPYKPLKPDPIKNTIFGAIIGFVLGVGVSMSVEYFDDSFHSISEAEQFLNLPVLAAIPKMNK